jgi:hypothetical protein
MILAYPQCMLAGATGIVGLPSTQPIPFNPQEMYQAEYSLLKTWHFI